MQRGIKQYLSAIFMATLTKSLSSVYINEGLMKLPVIASKYGMYGQFVPWRIGSGSRDEGIYFVMTDKPVQSSDIDIRKMQLEMDASNSFHTRYTCFPLYAEMSKDDTLVQNLTNQVIVYSENHRTVEDIFQRYNSYTKLNVDIPEQISPQDLNNILQTYALVRYPEEGKGLNAETKILCLRSEAEKGLITYLKRLQNIKEKYSKNPLLRALKIPNRDYLKYQYISNPRLAWSKNPLVRAYRWMKYRNSQKVSKEAITLFAGGDSKLTNVVLYTKYRDPETGKMHDDGLYQKFEKEMAEKYPNLIYHVEKIPTYNSGFVKVNKQKGEVNPFEKMACYEERVEVTYPRSQMQYINPIISKLQMTQDYSAEKAMVKLHPISLDELKKQGPVKVRYIDCNTVVGLNVGVLAEQNNIPYAIDDGTEYGGDCDGCLAYVFLEKDAWFADAALNRIVDDFTNTPGDSPLPEEYTVVDEPAVSEESNDGFGYSRDDDIQAAIKSQKENRISNSTKADDLLSL